MSKNTKRHFRAARFDDADNKMVKAGIKRLPRGDRSFSVYIRKLVMDDFLKHSHQ